MRLSPAELLFLHFDADNRIFLSKNNNILTNVPFNYSCKTLKILIQSIKYSHLFYNSFHLSKHLQLFNVEDIELIEETQNFIVLVPFIFFYYMFLKHGMCNQIIQFTYNKFIIVLIKGYIVEMMYRLSHVESISINI